MRKQAGAARGTARTVHGPKTGRPARGRRAADDLVFKVLADPTRREIIALLRSQSRSVGAIADHFSITRPAVSKHLALLREAGLVVDRADGATRICTLDAAPLRHVDAWLDTYKAFWTASLRRLKAHVERQNS